jgi:hypothetical protein
MGNRGAGLGKGFDIKRKIIFKLKTFLIINFQSPHRVLNSSKFIKNFEILFYLILEA